MLELAILGLLKEQQLHGYEVKKRLADTLGLASGVSFGSLYPALGRLERAGAVESSVEGTTVGTPIPNTGSLGGELAAFRARPAVRGRSRKVYAITARGEALFEELLAADVVPGEDTRTFNLRLAFARYLSSEARLGLLERRRSHLLERQRRLGSRGRVGSRIDSYLTSLMEHDREATAHDLSWIERLIASERAGAGPAVPATAEDPSGDDRDGLSRSARVVALGSAADRPGCFPPAPKQHPTPGRATPGAETPAPSAAGAYKEST